MNSIASILVFAAVVAVAAAAGYGGGASAGASSGGYGGASIPAPPCPKNYLFSCVPNLAPAPCAQPAPSYGSSGAYSENIPTILNAPYGYQLQGPQQHQQYQPFPYNLGQNFGNN